MEIRSKRLLMVPLGPQFLLSTHEYASDLDNTRYMMYLPNEDIEMTQDFLDKVHAEWQKTNPSFYEFAILLGDIHIGAVSIYMNKDNYEGELGWIIHKEYWGNGYAVEAASSIIKFAIEKLHVKRLIAHCDSENISSYRVMEKLGMVLVHKSKGRKNKSSDEEREEFMYLLEIE